MIEEPLFFGLTMRLHVGESTMLGFFLEFQIEH